VGQNPGEKNWEVESQPGGKHVVAEGLCKGPREKYGMAEFVIVPPTDVALYLYRSVRHYGAGANIVVSADGTVGAVETSEDVEDIFQPLEKNENLWYEVYLKYT